MSRGGRWLALIAITGVLATSCTGDARPEPAADTPPADTGVTFPDAVTVTTGPERPPGSTTTTAAARDLVVTVEAPEGFPSDFPRPPGAEVLAGSSATVGGDRVLAVDLEVAGSLDEVVRSLREAIEAADFALLDEAHEPGSASTPPSAGLRFETDDYVGDVFVTTTATGTSVVLTATMPRT